MGSGLKSCQERTDLLCTPAYCSYNHNGGSFCRSTGAIVEDDLSLRWHTVRTECYHCRKIRHIITVSGTGIEHRLGGTRSQYSISAKELREKRRFCLQVKGNSMFIKRCGATRPGCIRLAHGEWNVVFHIFYWFYYVWTNFWVTVAETQKNVTCYLPRFLSQKKGLLGRPSKTARQKIWK